MSTGPLFNLEKHSKQLISLHIVTYKIYNQDGNLEHHSNVIICSLPHYQHFLRILLISINNLAILLTNKKKMQKHHLLGGGNELYLNVRGKNRPAKIYKIIPLPFSILASSHKRDSWP